MSPERERVTEIGLLLVADGAVTAQWQTLVNPGKPIPSDISYFTGISNDMVRNAPPFGNVAQTLLEYLQGSVLVAHNARFDYGFLKAEFARLGRTYITKPLCTVKLSRALDPEERSHSLDALIARWRLSCEGRHRAMGDAQRLWEFVQKLYDAKPAQDIEAAYKRVTRHAALPPNLPVTLLDELPAAPGVYAFYGANPHPLYIGRSVQLRERVAAHFYDVKSEREQQLLAQTHRVEWTECAGPLSAAVLEAQRIKARMPAQNVALRRKERAVVLRISDQCKPAYALAGGMPWQGAAAVWFGPFGSRSSARQYVIELARAGHLCLKVMGLERAAAGAPEQGCFNRQIMRCRGACTGHEPLDALRARVLDALAPSAMPVWPHEGAIALLESNPARFTEDWIVADQWCVLGVVKTRAAAEALAAEAPRLFDVDVYRLLRKALDEQAVVALTGSAVTA